MPKITLKRVTNADGTVAELYPTTTLDQIISEGTGPNDSEGNPTNESLSSYLSSTYIPLSQKGASSGVAPLSGGKVPENYLPDSVYGGMTFVGTVSASSIYNSTVYMEELISGSGSSGSAITISQQLDDLTNLNYDSTPVGSDYDGIGQRYVGHYWVVSGSNKVTFNDSNATSAVWATGAKDDGADPGALNSANLTTEAGDWIIITGWDNTNKQWSFNIVNNTYRDANGTTKGIVGLSTASGTNSLTNGSKLAITEDVLYDLLVSDNSDLAGTTNTNKIAPAAHHHDGIYYTESEIDEFFDGTAPITGYNLDNWDTAYEDKIDSASFDTSDGVLTLTRQDSGTVTVDLDGRYAESVAVAQTDSTDGLDVSVTGGTYTLKHHDTSSQASVNNSDGTVIQDITLDTMGHITGLGSYNLDNRYYTESEFNNWLDGTAIDSHNFTEIKYGANLESGLPSSGNIVGTLLIETD